MHPEDLKSGRILVVDDQEANVLLLEGILQRAGYSNAVSTTDPRQVEGLFAAFQPDLVVLDLHMPHLDGFDVMGKLLPLVPAGDYLPILVLTADVSLEVKQRALAMGAKDFLTKPFNSIEAILRIRNLLETRFLHMELKDQNQLLEVKVGERTRELEAARIEILDRLALAAEFRDDATGEHTRRVGRTSGLVALALDLPEKMIDLIRKAAPLHDIGKIGVPDQILLKPGRLTPEEFERIKSHVTIGAKILSGSSVPLLQLAEEIALTHHERWDGGGYVGMSGEDIPLSGRIVAIADVFDALTHERPYKRAWTLEDAMEEIARQSGRQFDPEVVKALLDLHHRDLLVPSADGSEPVPAYRDSATAS